MKKMVLKNAEYNENKPCIQLEAAFSSIFITISEDPIPMKVVGQEYCEMDIVLKQKLNKNDNLQLLCIYISSYSFLYSCDICN